jgi:SAM-dependent methyltransferase
MAEARNYTAAILDEFAPYLRGTVAELGAGIGNCTVLLSQHPQVSTLLAVEPDAQLCRALKQRVPEVRVVQGTIDALAPAASWHALVSVNVLEHIADDAEELRKYHGVLASGRGCLCLFVPARPELYSPIDRKFGHYRRYTPAGLLDLVRRAGFAVLHWRYFNGPGYFLWGLVFRCLRRRWMNPRSIRAFDQYIFPWIHLVETHFLRPPIGQSLLLVARAGEINILT